jgi:hypothetical protein
LKRTGYINVNDDQQYFAINPKDLYASVAEADKNAAPNRRDCIQVIYDDGDDPANRYCIQFYSDYGIAPKEVRNDRAALRDWLLKLRFIDAPNITDVLCLQILLEVQIKLKCLVEEAENEIGKL